MATQEEELICPICQDALKDVAYVSPCLHKFCLGCIMRWAKHKSSCALCRQPVSSVCFSLRSEDDFLEMDLPPPAEPLEAQDAQEEQWDAESAAGTDVAGFPPEAWAAFFQQSVETLEPLLLWLNQGLLRACEWWEARLMRRILISTLCDHGLEELPLVRSLQPFLHHHTGTFVRQLIEAAAERCGEQMLSYMDQLGSESAEEQECSPAASPGPALSPWGTPTSSPEETPAPSREGTPTPSPQPTPAPSPGVTPSPNTSVEEEPLEELGQEVAAPSTAAQGGDLSPRRSPTSSSRRPPKRRASGSEDDASQPKRPPHRQD